MSKVKQFLNDLSEVSTSEEVQNSWEHCLEFDWFPEGNNVVLKYFYDAGRDAEPSYTIIPLSKVKEFMKGHENVTPVVFKEFTTFVETEGDDYGIEGQEGDEWDEE